VTSYERTGWRDQEISKRHRRWGFNCPAVDLDFMLLEFNHGVPVAVVDYKHHAKTEPLDGLDGNAVKALGGLYDERGENLPFFVTRYWPDSWAFKVLPMNDRACTWLTQGSWIGMTEQQWVTGLYKMRKLALGIRDIKYIERLNTSMPPVEEDAA
jgi:hypothetical protein